MTTTPEFIYILRPTRGDMLRIGATPREAEVIARHFAYLQGLCSRGIVVVAGRTTTSDEHTFGICIFRSASQAAAEALMHADPAVSEGVMSATLSPFRIALLAAAPAPEPLPPK